VAGRHKVFLGMAAGVGKTYRMLAEGQAAVEEGIDVVVGVLETHGRAETAAQALALEVLPRVAVEHRGAVLEELDLPGLLTRAPDLALIDELAHTNAPGLPHAKRYEDVDDALAAGIDVFSTLNVQHLESLNDQVAELTGVHVRETVPDAVLARADELLLIDLSPEALVARLREGKIYPQARVPAALANFFRVENLQALREVALRQVAEDVETRRFVRDPGRRGGDPGPAPIGERLLALARLGGSADQLVRRSWRSAQRLGGELDVLVVRDPEAAPTATEREELESLRRITSTLGAHLLVDEETDVARAVVRVARERGTTYVLMGPPNARRGLHRLTEPLILRLVRAMPDVDVRIVAEQRPIDPSSR
jgi:two-component system sensor histidine kinase KdpD